MNQRLPTPATGRVARNAVERIGFWGSVLLPTVYLPILYATSGTEQLLVVVAVVAANVACLVAGHRYH